MKNAGLRPRSRSSSPAPNSGHSLSEDVPDGTLGGKIVPVKANTVKNEKPVNLIKEEVSSKPTNEVKASDDTQGSPKKKQKTGNVRDKTEELSESDKALLKSAAIAWSRPTASPFDSSRDSLIGDAAHLEHLAKITQVFMKPVKTAPKLNKGTGHAYVRQMSIEDLEEKQVHLCPKVEGRIVRADQQVHSSCNGELFFTGITVEQILKLQAKEFVSFYFSDFILRQIVTFLHCYFNLMCFTLLSVFLFHSNALLLVSNY